MPVIVHVSQSTDWWATLLSGAIGAVIGTLGAFGAAALLVRGERNSDRALARENARVHAASDLLLTLETMRRAIYNHDGTTLSTMVNAANNASQEWPTAGALAPSVSPEVKAAVYKLSDRSVLKSIKDPNKAPEVYATYLSGQRTLVLAALGEVTSFLAKHAGEA